MHTNTQLFLVLAMTASVFGAICGTSSIKGGNATVTYTGPIGSIAYATASFAGSNSVDGSLVTVNNGAGVASQVKLNSRGSVQIWVTGILQSNCNLFIYGSQVGAGVISLWRVDGTPTQVSSSGTTANGVNYYPTLTYSGVADANAVYDVRVSATTGPTTGPCTSTITNVEIRTLLAVC